MFSTSRGGALAEALGMDAHLRRGPRPAPAEAPAWRLDEVTGRLTEICGEATLTMAFTLVRDAQRRRETTAWVTGPDSVFYAPDVAAGGVDLAALAVARVPSPAIPRAAWELASSGAFGLLVLDLPRGVRVPDALLGRLLGVAQRHEAAIVFLTETPAFAPSLGALVSLRGEARHARRDEDVFSCTLAFIKDKRRAPGWTHVEACRGPAGLR